MNPHNPVNPIKVFVNGKLIRNRFAMIEPNIPTADIAMICPISNGKYMSPDPKGFIVEKISMVVLPTSAPMIPPRVKPARNTVTEMNSIFGIIMNMKPNPIDTAENIAAETKSFNFIVLQKI